MCTGDEAVPDRARVDEPNVAASGEAEASDDLAVRVEDGLPDVGADDRPAVCERGVGDGELERRDRKLSLADRQVDGVALVPDAFPGLLERPLQPAGGRYQAGSLARDVKACRVADAKPLGPVLYIEVALLLFGIEHRPEPVEPCIARDRQRLRQRHAGVDSRLDVVEDVTPDGVGARALEGRVGADQP